MHILPWPSGVTQTIGAVVLIGGEAGRRFSADPGVFRCRYVQPRRLTGEVRNQPSRQNIKHIVDETESSPPWFPD